MQVAAAIVFFTALILVIVCCVLFLYVTIIGFRHEFKRAEEKEERED